MSTRTVLKCDQCGSEIAEHARHFTLNATLRALNGDTRSAWHGEERDLCSHACLIAAVNGMITQVTEPAPMPISEPAP